MCVDNIFALLYFPVTSALAAKFPDVQQSSGTNEAFHTALSTPISAQSILSTGFLSAVLLWLGQKLGGTAGALPLCTLLTVLVATIGAKRILSLKPTASTLGTGCLYLFFATGAPDVGIYRLAYHGAVSQ